MWRTSYARAKHAQLVFEKMAARARPQENLICARAENSEHFDVEHPLVVYTPLAHL